MCVLAKALLNTVRTLVILIVGEECKEEFEMGKKTLGGVLTAPYFILKYMSQTVN